MDTLSPPGDIDTQRMKHLAWLIVFGNLKGGVAKTTGTWLMAWAIYLLTGEKVMIVDADPLSQSLASSYRKAIALGIDLPFILVEWRTPDGFVKGIQAEMKRHGVRHCVVDVGGEHEKLLEQACIVGDELIIPTTPDDLDLERVPATLSVASRMSGLTDINVNILLAKVSTNPRNHDADEAYAWLTDPDRRGWPVLDTRIPDKVFYHRATRDFPEDAGQYMDVLKELARIRLDEQAA